MSAVLARSTVPHSPRLWPHSDVARGSTPPFGPTGRCVHHPNPDRMSLPHRAAKPLPERASLRWLVVPLWMVLIAALVLSRPTLIDRLDQGGWIPAGAESVAVDSLLALVRAPVHKPPGALRTSTTGHDLRKHTAASRGRARHQQSCPYPWRFPGPDPAECPERSDAGQSHRCRRWCLAGRRSG